MWSDHIDHEIINILKPKSFIFEPQKNFDHDSLIFCKPFFKLNKEDIISDWTWSDIKNKKISDRILYGNSHKKNKDVKNICKNIANFGFNLHSMFYSIYRSNQLKNEYEFKNNIEYDLVIRARLDTYLENNINLSNFNPKYFYTPKWSRWINDTFAISGKENMDYYCSTYFNLNEILYHIYNDEEINYLCMEAISYKFLKDKNIPLKIIENNNIHTIK